MRPPTHRSRRGLRALRYRTARPERARMRCLCLSRPRSSAFSAVTVPCGCARAIVHNDSHHPYRQRSNICHELAHCFLGHECTPPLTEEGERARDGGIEAEANFLAGALLVPNEAAVHIVRQDWSTARESTGSATRCLSTGCASAGLAPFRCGCSRSLENHARASAQADDPHPLTLRTHLDKIDTKALQALIRTAVALNTPVHAAAGTVRSRKRPKSARGAS